MFDEAPSHAWRLRYGQDAPSLPDLARFLNHRCVRKYTDAPVEEAIIEGLVAAAQSAGSSSNLQLWSLVSVQDPTSRDRIAHIASNQAQVRDAAWFFVFLADHHRLRRAAATVGEQAEGLSFTEFYTMAIVDAALACERMVCAAEALGLGICYIGALRNDPQGVAEVLNLPEGTFPVFGLTIGWPDLDHPAAIKPRLSQDSIWFRERYQESPSVADYDHRMRAFYEEQHMKGEVTWSMRSGRRVDAKHLEGREGQLEWLQGQGFLKK